MIIKKDLIKRDIAGETVLVPCGKTIYDSNGLFILNELGAFLWDLLPTAEGEAELVSAVLAEYEVAEETARGDIGEFLDKLREMDII
ncbi:MAG: PqqD family protein [Ruminococcaceae bacterium]|nr:PqqD family protein [Oscillospiraceae bacterium]